MRSSMKLTPLLDAGDTLIDGGNSHYHDDIARAKRLSPKGLHYIDMGIDVFVVTAAGKLARRSARAPRGSSCGRSMWWTHSHWGNPAAPDRPRLASRMTSPGPQGLRKFEGCSMAADGITHRIVAPVASTWSDWK